MNERHVIDEVFFRKLENLEVHPTPEAGEKLLALLEEKKPSKKKPIWPYAAVGIAACIMLALGIVLQTPEKQPNAVVAIRTPQPIKPQFQSSAIVPDWPTTKYSRSATAHTGKFQPTFTGKLENRRLKLPHSSQRIEVDNPAARPDQTLAMRGIPTSSSEAVVIVAMPQVPEKNDLSLEEASPTAPPEQSEKTRVGRIIAQLRNLKAGDKVDLKEVGLDKESLLAMVRAKTD